MNNPTIVWQHDIWRIVATPPLPDHDLEDTGVCVLEVRDTDALGGESWRGVLDNDNMPEVMRCAIITLVEEVVLKLDVLPLWVREFMSEQRRRNESDEEEGGGAA